MAVDARKVEVYCYLIKTNQKTIADVPVTYKAEVEAKLPYFNITDIVRLNALEEQYKALTQTTDELSGNVGGLIDYIFTQLNL